MCSNTSYTSIPIAKISHSPNIHPTLHLLTGTELASNRRHVEGLMNQLELATKELHLAHNAYVISSHLGQHFFAWCSGQMRPCLLAGILRTLRLASSAT
ncbi:unnamed protein product [Protopolystoma xenopodis]|uniref:Uncharacterized protein n=1 Tax=Protopolystoma xenopodis TaxID=117903 RepID=A0A448WRG6_9PLAT|nr:unnamed protein product [Protopolystoma xenopodis]